MKKGDQEKIQEILDFWFVKTTPEQKYKKDDVFDAKVTQRFKSVYEQVMIGETEQWRETSEGRLAEIIVLDQFARNMFRGDAQSFLGDDLALKLSREALLEKADEDFPQEKRQFFYMPFMHSESRAVHVEALKIFQEKSDEGGLKYEIMHKEIIDQFGRYPHRNEVMGRQSTLEEVEFLKQHSGF